MNSNNKQTEQGKSAVSDEIDSFKAELNSIQSKLLGLYHLAPIELELTMEKKSRVLSQIRKQ